MILCYLKQLLIKLIKNIFSFFNILNKIKKFFEKNII